LFKIVFTKKILKVSHGQKQMLEKSRVVFSAIRNMFKLTIRQIKPPDAAYRRDPHCEKKASPKGDFGTWLMKLLQRF
jgi:phage gp16-like protein